MSPATASGQPVPAYCTDGHGVLTPQQWSTCASIGWHQPPGTPMSTDTASGSTYGGVLVVILLVVALIALARGRSRTPATAK